MSDPNQALEDYTRPSNGNDNADRADIALPTTTDEPAILTRQQLRKGVRDRFHGLRAFEVEYASYQRSFEGDESIVPHSWRHFAVKDEKRFTAHSNSRIRAYDGNKTCHIAGAMIFLKRGKQKQPSLDQDGFLGTVEIPLAGTSRRRALRTISYWLTDLNTVVLGWRVLRRLELVDGVPCHVLDSRRMGQRLWIDPKTGFAIRFREWYVPSRKASANERAVYCRCAYRNFSRVGNRVWLPWRIETVWYSSDFKLHAGQQKPKLVARYEVRRLAVNEDIPDSLFTPQLHAGALVVDYVRTRRYRIGENNEEIDCSELSYNESNSL
jgi:hypothetical protein